jgi:hypothetical protein
VTISGDAYVPVIKDLPPELRKLRIVAPPLELVMLPEKGQHSWSVSHDPNEKISLEQIRDVAGILSWLSSGTAEMEIFMDGRHLMDGIIDAEASSEGHFWKRLYLVTKALIVAVPPDRRPPTLSYSVVDLLGGLDDIAKFAVYSTESATMRLEKPLSVFEGLMDFLGTYWIRIEDVIFYATVQAVITSVVAEKKAPAGSDNLAQILQSRSPI